MEDIEDFRKIKDEDKKIVSDLLKDFEKFKDNKGEPMVNKTSLGFIPWRQVKPYGEVQERDLTSQFIR